MDKVQDSITNCFCGFSNHSNITFLNCMWQWLFFTPEYRERVFKVDLKKTDLDPNSKEYKIIYELQLLFYRMKVKNLSSLSHASISKLVGYEEGVEDETAQGDIMEAFAFIADRIDSAFKKAKAGPPAESTFFFKIYNTMTCTNCKNVNEKPENALQLSAEVKNKKTVVQAANDFTEPEVIDDYHCSNCKKSTQLEKGQQCRDYGNCFIFAAKRFTLSFQTFTIEKIHNKVEFDLVFDGEEIGGNENDKYELYGVLAHKGSAQQGHFTVYLRDVLEESNEVFDDTSTFETEFEDYPNIKTMKKGWYKFFDSVVMHVSVAELKKVFGGSSFNYSFLTLFYRRAGLDSRNQEIKETNPPDWVVQEASQA